ncbi:MAG: sensor domain-containing diguanylate cyclase, partial [Candidatus Omnitrophica bacterium]|nr:sensor domain-containing diguanylate cyclase [Candidatus Omnitrophota bacterium]
DESFKNRVSVIAVEREKEQNEINDLEVDYRVKGEGISIFFEKYSTYYNLRKLAEEFATTLSVSQIAHMLLNRIVDFIPRGDVALVTLADPEEKRLAVIAAKQLKKPDVPYSPNGDLFDAWAIKNRKRLIVLDTQVDFRFDSRELPAGEILRSLIVAPLLHQGRVMGTLRVNSGMAHTFSNDDLRVLDTTSVLASSALSNAMLYEQTKELSIRDSLTGLYVRRYFFERLKEEHQRFLLTHRPLSLLMCDLDHFKECNDRFGHGVGDLMLIHFSQILKKSGENLVLGRYGGEEFAILCPETTKEEGGRIAESIRQTVEATPLVIRRENIPLTVSIGVANVPVDALDYEILIQRSDQALYRAKREGRNRICLSTA